MKHAAFHYLDHDRPREAFRRALAGIEDDGSHMQRIELDCPSDRRHTLGQIVTDAASDTVEVVPFSNADGPRLWRQGAVLAFDCTACRHQRTVTVGTIPLDRLIDLAAWLAWSFPNDWPGPPARAEVRIPARRDAITEAVGRLRNGSFYTGEPRTALRDRLLDSVGLLDAARHAEPRPGPWDR